MDSIRVFKGLKEDAWSSFDIYSRDPRKSTRRKANVWFRKEKITSFERLFFYYIIT